MWCAMIHGMPGPGGYLGQCAVCGGAFVAESLGCGKVHQVEVVGIDGDVCLHGNCMTLLERARDDGWETLPQGPLRSAYERAAEEHDERHRSRCPPAARSH